MYLDTDKTSIQTQVKSAQTTNPCFDGDIQSLFQGSFVFDTPPSDYQANVEIAAIFVLVKDKLLFLKRHSNVAKGNTWAMPAGKVKDSEQPLQAAIRELKEETSIIADNLKFLKTVYIREPNQDYTYHMFGIELDETPNEISLKQDETTAHQWLTRAQANELNSKNLLILDEMPCIQRIFGNQDFTNQCLTK